MCRIKVRQNGRGAFADVDGGSAQVHMVSAAVQNRVHAVQVKHFLDALREQLDVEVFQTHITHPDNIARAIGYNQAVVCTGKV